MLFRLSLRYGWRGLWLMVMGAMWIAFGFGVLNQPDASLSWVLYQYFPPSVQAAGWWITGAVALGQGLRGPVRDDSLGHVALYLMPAVRMISFLLSWLIFLGSEVAQNNGWFEHSIGYSGGWYAAFIWSLISLMLGLGASWPNPEPPVIPMPPPSARHKV